jgi:hypothetical protein
MPQTFFYRWWTASFKAASMSAMRLKTVLSASCGVEAPRKLARHHAKGEAAFSPNLRVSCTQHTSAYVSIRQYTPAYASIRRRSLQTCESPAHSIRHHTSAYASIRQHTTAFCTNLQVSCTHTTHPHTYTGAQVHSQKFHTATQTQMHSYTTHAHTSGAHTHAYTHKRSPPRAHTHTHTHATHTLCFQSDDNFENLSAYFVHAISHEDIASKRQIKKMKRIA